MQGQGAGFHCGRACRLVAQRSGVVCRGACCPLRAGALQARGARMKQFNGHNIVEGRHCGCVSLGLPMTAAACELDTVALPASLS
jgi:hypothetical protein